ncbi:MAG: RT0821/Lpp0805 family surface protein [Tistlia sp.]|uniref:RT0821/Lpp0805 family surface protein n=1 Tax=Tistlia sp. TaxID=3057121 RepID=UPI0034A517FE
MIMTRPARTTAALTLALGLVAIPLAGCDTIERQTGLSSEAQGGVLSGAAVGGVVSALAGANPFWIAASTVLGGAAGGAIGDYLGRRNAEQHAQNNLNALNTLSPGQKAEWSDPETGNSGRTEVHSVYTSNGRTCKTYTETVRTSQQTVSEEGTACQTASGGWEVV